MREKELKPSAGESWTTFIRRTKPKASQIRVTVAALHARRDHKTVVEVINAALINGRAAPWMYDILAMSLKLSGGSQDDIERALLSRVDFSAADVPGMLLSAAYLKRLGASAQALKLYQQASRLAPLRPEPYVLGMRIARDAKDWENVSWGAEGILRVAWIGNYQPLQREARGVAADAAAALKKAGKKKEAAELEARIGAALENDLFVRIRWSGPGDLDLLVEEPSGAVCSRKNRRTRSGGFLVRDGAGPNQKNCFEEYVCPVGMSGKYRIRVRHVIGDIVGKRATLEVVRHRNSNRQVIARRTVLVRRDDSVIEVELTNGRASKKPSASSAQARGSRPRRDPK